MQVLIAVSRLLSLNLQNRTFPFFTTKAIHANQKSKFWAYLGMLDGTLKKFSQNQPKKFRSATDSRFKYGKTRFYT